MRGIVVPERTENFTADPVELYFHRPDPALELRGEQATGRVARGCYVRDVYTWAHAPFVIGVILLVAIDVVILVMLIVENRRIED